MKIVVDSNIIFSAILNTQSRIGQLILNGSRFFDFYTISLLKDEIISHRDKILLITGFTQSQFDNIFQLLISRITFIDDILLTDSEINIATDLVADIDENDSLFVALNNHLSAFLWTGDKRLISGLKKKGYVNTLTTDNLFQLFIEKQLENMSKK